MVLVVVAVVVVVVVVVVVAVVAVLLVVGAAKNCQDIDFKRITKLPQAKNHHNSFS